MIAFATYVQLLWVALLALAGRPTFAFVMIVVELDPVISTSPVACSSSFLSEVEGNLTTWVIDATTSISFLSDFSVPGGLQLSDVSVDPSRTRTLNAQTGFNKCTSQSCVTNTGIGLCKLCSGSRRRRGLQGTTSPANSTSAETMVIDWSTVGTDVTKLITPSLINFVVVNQDAAAGCLGDPNALSLKVSFLSDVPFDTAMENALIVAFGTPAVTTSTLATSSHKASSSTATSSTTTTSLRTTAACCTLDFKRCDRHCGKTQTQCESCSVPDVAWLPQGPPKTKCIPRRHECTNNELSCCPGTQCLGDQFWKGCVHVPALQV